MVHPEKDRGTDRQTDGGGPEPTQDKLKREPQTASRLTQLREESEGGRVRERERAPDMGKLDPEREIAGGTALVLLPSLQVQCGLWKPAATHPHAHTHTATFMHAAGIYVLATHASDESTVC